MPQEQLLENNGGDSVAITGEWGFVGDVDDCQVYVYRFDPITDKWGDGGKNTGIIMSTLQVIPALKDGGLNSYTLTLDAGETSCQLRWVLGPLKGKYFEPGEGAMRYLAQQRKALSKQTKNKGAKAGGAQHGASQVYPVFGLPPGR